MENQRRYEVQKTMQQPVRHGSANTELFSILEVDKVISLINRMRLLQGFSMLDPDEADLMAATWLIEFKRKHVPAELYDDLVEKAFDYRVRLLQDGTTPPPFDLAELLAIFRGYYIVEFQQYCDDCREDYGDLITIESDGTRTSRRCKHENYPEPPKIKRR